MGNEDHMFGKSADEYLSCTHTHIYAYIYICNIDIHVLNSALPYTLHQNNPTIK